MMHEGGPSGAESAEGVEALFTRELKKALSTTWPKTTQELLPGFLPDKPTNELTKEELEQYRSAFKILGEMVERDEVEVLFGEGDRTSRKTPALADERLARPRFKWKTHGGKRSKHEVGEWEGSLATDLGA